MGKARIDLKPRVMVEDVRAMGPGKADLLALIDREGSISGAAKAMKMSYRRAWLLVEAMNSAFKRPLVATAAGGSGGGGAQLTPEGRELLEIYRRLQTAVTETAADFEAEFQAHLK